MLARYQRGIISRPSRGPTKQRRANRQFGNPGPGSVGSQVCSLSRRVVTKDGDSQDMQPIGRRGRPSTIITIARQGAKESIDCVLVSEEAPLPRGMLSTE